MASATIDETILAFERARRRRAAWEGLWRDCYQFAQPNRGHGFEPLAAGSSKHVDRLFDGTAPDAVEQLAASLLAELTPPWSRWFGLRSGHDVPQAAEDEVDQALEDATERLQGHFERSNFAVEIHQCFLDLVTIGTATLVFQEAPLGTSSAFEFTAVPPSEMFLEGDDVGLLRHQFRLTSTTVGALRARFPESQLLHAGRDEEIGHEQPVELVESVSRRGPGYDFRVFVPAGSALGSAPVVLGEGQFESSPFITFRWLKGTGEIYGRSPVMTALPDIKTANKVVELILKNASIAVTGIWLAEDDGVLDPANIRLAPGTIIPKAVGTAGLTPLQAPGRFDVSELVLNDLRSQIRHTLLVDRLRPVSGRQMTATEVLERTAEMSRLLGAIYGRLQAELLTPLLARAVAVLGRRGEISRLSLDGRAVELHHRSPLARVQAREDVRNTLFWLDTVSKLGGEAASAVDQPAAARWLASMLGVPNELLARRRSPDAMELFTSMSEEQP